MFPIDLLWTRTFPELRLLARADRRLAIRDMLQLCIPRRRMRRYALDFALSAAALILITALATARSILWFALIVLIGGLIAWLAYPLNLWWEAVRERSRFQDQIRRQVTQLGSPVCVECGYDLRGARAQRCSECGRPLPLMRFRIEVAGGASGTRALDPNGQNPEFWNVTALSAAHARKLLHDHFALDKRGQARIINVRQVVEQPAERCGDVIRETAVGDSAPR
jgi:hypothetical protein